MIEILSVQPNSIADDLGLGRGDQLVSINGEEVNDIIDYTYLVSDEQVLLKLRKKSGRTRSFRIAKDADDMLGIEFAPFTIKRCRNKCIFCFVDQMPPACRKSLYIKDDDFRASFLHGNYITLGSLRESDWERIFKQRLSPLYISVHSTDPALRSFMIGNNTSPDIMTSMRRLAANGIRMHTQIVLCPGVNDGKFLERTLDDLSGLFPAIASVAVVPVGITTYRAGLFPLRKFTTREARAVLDIAVRFGDMCKKQFGSRFVFASDEFYIQAGTDSPPLSFYGDLPQIENGVGMVTSFLHGALRTRMPARVSPIALTVVTGVSFRKVIKRFITLLQGIPGVKVNLVVVKNKFFGPSVTVAGLLTGSDIVSALKRRKLGELVLIPASMLKEGENLFLDNMTVKQLEERINVAIRPVESFRDMVMATRGKRSGA